MNYINDFIHCDVVWTQHENCDEDGHNCHYYYTCENVCFFNEINHYNNILFILYLIGIALTILYPIIIISIYGCDYHKLNEEGGKK